jgi:hypothetical protein
MAGRLIADGDELCFVPRFPFVAGTRYAVWVDGKVRAVLLRPSAPGAPTTQVLEIYPTAAEVPANLLRFSVQFSGPMSDGRASRHVHLLDDAGVELENALLSTDFELWDRDHTRLTVLLDPGRIKRGLPTNRAHGYPLRPGESFRLVVDDTFLDAAGRPLMQVTERRYNVGPEERRRIAPSRWTLTAPRAGTRDPLVVTFERPLDHTQLQTALQVLSRDNARVDGSANIGPGETEWRWVPSTPWRAGAHHVVVDPILEDLAGNSLRRVFDRDIAGAEDAPGSHQLATLGFNPS